MGSSKGLSNTNPVQENGDRPLKRENPHKYLLYKPTFSQIMVFLASGKTSSIYVIYRGRRYAPPFTVSG